MTHRALLPGIGLLLLASCRSHDQRGAPGEHNGAAVFSSAAPQNARGTALSGNAAQRAACLFRAGALPADTVDSGARTGRAIPIEHFVVVLQENRSFDSYFQALPSSGQPDAEVAPANYDNPDPSGEGEVVYPFLQKDPCVPDVPHNFIAVRHQIADGKMNGFLSAANPDGRRAVGYYDASTLGYYYALASTFALGDRYFASVPGPTFPNRMFYLSASSFGHATNSVPPPRDEEKTLFHLLEKKGLSWIIYSVGETFEERMYPRLHAEKGAHFRSIAEFYSDAKAGKLPFFAWVESTYGGPHPNDEHAPGDVQVGQAFVAGVIQSLFESPNWHDSALFLSYDEHGGFFDHVPPPKTCPPDDEPPRVPGIKQTARFDTLGLRVPFIVVSPFARAHFVSHHVYSHTSVLRLVEARADLPALSQRDANDDPPYDVFDFEHPPFLAPPKLPPAQIDELEAKRCVVLAEQAQAKREVSALPPTQ